MQSRDQSGASSLCSSCERIGTSLKGEQRCIAFFLLILETPTVASTENCFYLFEIEVMKAKDLLQCTLDCQYSLRYPITPMEIP